MINNAVVVDLDGTLLHPEPAQIAVKGRSGYCYLAGSTALLLSKISVLLPVIIATGRNAASVGKLTAQIPEVQFAGFVLENGCAQKRALPQNSFCNETSNKSARNHTQWDFLLTLLPEWEQISGYEHCLCLIPPSVNQKEAACIVRQLLRNYDVEGCVYPEGHKIFIYPQAPNKMSGLSQLIAHPFICLGNDNNDMQILESSSCPITLSTASEQIRNIVKNKKGYCSQLSSHAAAEDMLSWAYSRLQSNME